MTMHSAQRLRRPAEYASTSRALREPAGQTVAILSPVSPMGALQGRLQSLADASTQTAQLRLLDRAARGRASEGLVQRVRAVVQFERTVTNSQAANMRESLVRMFGGKASDWEIDKESGKTFNDNNDKDTTGHHDVIVTDKRDGSVWKCDFHQNGKYYTRGGAA